MVSRNFSSRVRSLVRRIFVVFDHKDKTHTHTPKIHRYEPGVTPGDPVHKNIFAFPKPNNREHKVARPTWFDEPQSWPGSDFDKYAKFTVPTRPVPPPGGGEAGAASEDA